jgi:hypothetical protein
MKPKRINITIISLSFLLVFFYGCIKEKFDSSNFDSSLNLHPGLAVPVGYSHLGFEKYLAEAHLQDELRIGNDGFLSLYHFAEIDSGTMGDILSINDVSVNSSINNQTGSVIFLNAPGTSFDLVDSILIPISIPQINARIDSVSLRTGTLLLDITSPNITGTVTFAINGLRLNGTPFSTTTNLSNPDFTIPLDNYSLIPEHDIAGNNIVKCIISIHLQSPAGPINPGGLVMDVLSGLSNLQYETIYGNFGGYTINVPAKTISTPFFRQLEGEILFADPKFKLFFSNSVGVPIGISFSRIDAIDKNNISHPLTGLGIPTAANPKIIGYPSLNQAGTTINDSLIFDRNNTNLPDFIAVSPDSITIKASAEIGLLAPSATSFIRYDSKYKISATMELPLWGKADILVLLDTMDFDYLSSALPPPEEIEKLIVRTSITNSFPVTAYPQIYLLDAGYVVLDSLFTGTQKIEGATDTNGDGKADPHKQPPIDIDLPRSRIDNLLNTRYIIVKGRIMTTDFPSQDVKFYSSYFLDYNVGVIAQLKILTGK